MPEGVRINVGCGRTPTPGWRNFDNSPSIRMARWPLLPELLHRSGLLSGPSYDFVKFARTSRIEFANAVERIPVPAGSADVLYSSHMVEHLDAESARQFLRSALAALRPGGIIRLAVPDIRLRAERYIATGDADGFVQSLGMAWSRPRGLAGRVKLAWLGNRRHNWMYDGPSLCKLLTENGFVDAAVLPAGATTIRDAGPLDLSERAEESVYVEARKPGA